jgi:hypothetical protein
MNIIRGKESEEPLPAVTESVTVQTGYKTEVLFPFCVDVTTEECRSGGKFACTTITSKSPSEAVFIFYSFGGYS